MTRIETAAHAFLIDREPPRLDGAGRRTLFVLEMEPAAWAILATNEAEKAAEVKVMELPP